MIGALLYAIGKLDNATLFMVFVAWLSWIVMRDPESEVA